MIFVAAGPNNLVPFSELFNNLAAEAGNSKIIEDCMNENYPSNATGGGRKDGCMKEDDVLNRSDGKSQILKIITIMELFSFFQIFHFLVNYLFFDSF